LGGIFVFNERKLVVISKWQNTGIWIDEDNLPDGYKYLSLPIVFAIDGDTYLIITTRDKEGRSIPLQAKIKNINDVKNVNFEDSPLLEFGGKGHFDEDGVMPCQVYSEEGRHFMLFIGWNKGLTVPFRNAIGIAEWINGKWEKLFNGPILDRNWYDTCFVASPFLIKLCEDEYRLFYLSCRRWENRDNKLVHFYDITFADSKSLSCFNASGRSIITFNNQYEYAFSRPFVLKTEDCFKMWYSYRASPNNQFYNLGYAESIDGTDWIRKDESLVIERYGKGRDDQDICYGYIWFENGSNYMLYNGNDYGLTGFGIFKEII
jgi:hypothetical protein